MGAARSVIHSPRSSCMHCSKANLKQTRDLEMFLKRKSTGGHVEKCSPHCITSHSPGMKTCSHRSHHGLYVSHRNNLLISLCVRLFQLCSQRFRFLFCFVCFLYFFLKYLLFIFDHFIHVYNLS